MKSVEFEGTVSQDGQIVLPPEVVRAVPAGEHLRVVVMWDPAGADTSWRAAGRQRFESAYCPDDRVYERLIDDDSAAG